MAAILLASPVSVAAYDVTDKLAIGGILAGAYQHQEVWDAPGFNDTGRGAVSFQPEISFRPTDNDEIRAKFGFAGGNGLSGGASPFSLKPWGADLEDDVKEINGRNRDYLLTVWYKYTFHFGEEQTLGLVGGIIDATDYLDDNVYANDQYTQFMNQALVDAPNGFFPSYDIGGAAVWEVGNWDLTGVAMSVGENSEGRSYTFYGGQFRYAANWSPGKGNYRVILTGTSKDFSDTQGTGDEALAALIFSLDQQLGEDLGVWLRFGWQDDEAAVDHESIYSGGVDIRGSLWNREIDNVGIGYAYLDEGNTNIESTQVLEGYYRLVLTEIFALTGDVQYIREELRNQEDPKGFIFGVRATAQF